MDSPNQQSFLSQLYQPYVRKLLVLSAMLMVFQELSGENGLIGCIIYNVYPSKNERSVGCLIGHHLGQFNARGFRVNCFFAGKHDGT